MVLSETLSLKRAITKTIPGQALLYQEGKVLALEMGLGGKNIGKGEVEAAAVTPLIITANLLVNQKVPPSSLENSAPLNRTGRTHEEGYLQKRKPRKIVINSFKDQY